MTPRFALRKGQPLALGVNYRLSYGWDFGDSPGTSRLSLIEPERRKKVDDDFALFAREGLRVVRWFVFCDGRNGIRFAGEEPTGLDATAMPALEVAVELARKHGLFLLLVLLDHTFHFHPVPIPGTAMVKQGRGEVLRQDQLFERLLDKVFAPIFSRFADDPHIFGYELMNEPEMAMEKAAHLFAAATGAGWHEVPAEHQMPLETMQRRMGQCRELVHRLTRAQFSVGSMNTKWLANWQECVDPERDFLSFHYYGQKHEVDYPQVMEERVLPLAQRFAMGLGEFYPNGMQVLPPGRSSWPDLSARDFLEYAIRHGLQWAAPWVWRPGTNDPGLIPLPHFQNFQVDHAERLYPWEAHFPLSSKAGEFHDVSQDDAEDPTQGKVSERA